MEQLWSYNQNTIEEKLKGIIILKYKNLDMKLTKLTQKHTVTPQKHDSFYPWVVNNINITFFDKETTFLEKKIILFNNNNNNNLLQLGCHPVVVVFLHVYKIWNCLLLNLSREGYMRSM